MIPALYIDCDAFLQRHHFWHVKRHARIAYNAVVAWKTPKRAPFVQSPVYASSGPYRGTVKARWRVDLDSRPVGSEVPPLPRKRAPSVQANVDAFRSLVTQRRGCWAIAIPADERGVIQWRDHRGRLHRAFVFAWTCRHGPVPKGCAVKLVCGNPACGNPSHARLVDRATGDEVAPPPWVGD